MSRAAARSPCQANCIAVARDSRRGGHSENGRSAETTVSCWEGIAARRAADEGEALYWQRGAAIEPVAA